MFAAVVAVVVASWLIGMPRRVDSITLSNPTAYQLHVSVGTPGGDVTPIATLSPGQTREVRDVVDVGDVWVLHIKGQGRVAGDVTINRVDLEAHRWSLDLPSSLETSLREQGAELSPR